MEHASTHSALIDTATLQQFIQNNQPQLLIIDLCSADNYQQGHIPGAVHILPSQLSCGEKPAPGKLPSIQQLQQLFEAIGLTPTSHVVVYDDAGGSWAGRMIWTLDLIGHSRSQLLNGGRKAWIETGLKLSTEIPIIEASQLDITLDQQLIADIEEIQQSLQQPDFAIWDARSKDEYDGSKILAQRGGHIPGATHMEWTDLTDENGKILDVEILQNMLNEAGLRSDKRIVTHCQTHRRSGLTYFVAKKLLHYKRIKAYPGSWSEWGNSNNTPIESETFKQP